VFLCFFPPLFYHFVFILTKYNCCSYWVCRVIIFINLAFVSLMPLWGVPFIKGLNTATEFYIAAAIFGFQTGSYQSFSRTLLSHLTPLGCESEFFSLYELTDKGSAWLGPVVLTVVREATGNLRWGLFAIIFFFIVGGIFLFFVDPKEGGLQAADFHASAEVKIEDVVASDPSVTVVEEPQSERELAARVAKKHRAMSASRIELPAIGANDGDEDDGDEDEERVGGLLANEAPDPTTATPRVIEAPPDESPEEETVKPRRKTTRKGTRKNTEESTRKRKETEGYSTRQLPLPEVPEEDETKENENEDENEKSD
jgi:hypothetical protein